MIETASLMTMEEVVPGAFDPSRYDTWRDGTDGAAPGSTSGQFEALVQLLLGNVARQSQTVLPKAGQQAKKAETEKVEGSTLAALQIECLLGSSGVRPDAAEMTAAPREATPTVQRVGPPESGPVPTGGARAAIGSVLEQPNGQQAAALKPGPLAQTAKSAAPARETGPPAADADALPLKAEAGGVDALPFPVKPEADGAVPPEDSPGSAKPPVPGTAPEAQTGAEASPAALSEGEGRTVDSQAKARADTRHVPPEAVAEPPPGTDKGSRAGNSAAPRAAAADRQPPVSQPDVAREPASDSDGRAPGRETHPVVHQPPPEGRISGFQALDAVRESNANLPPERVISAKVIHQIVREARSRTFDGGGDMMLRLDPPHLGAVRMNVALVEGRMTASIEVSTATARQAIESDIPALRHSLSEAGVTVDAITVSLDTTLAESWGRDPREAYDQTRLQSQTAGRRSSVAEQTDQTGAVVAIGPGASGRFDYLA